MGLCGGSGGCNRGLGSRDDRSGGRFQGAPFLAGSFLAQGDFDLCGEDGDFRGGGVDGSEERVESEVVFGAGGEGELDGCLCI